MGWDAVQRKRLGMEKELLERYFPGRVTWTDPTGNTKVEVRMTTSNDKSYTLRVYIPDNCLNSCPTMVVCNPSSQLRTRNGNVIHGAEDHSWGEFDGLTNICHFHSSRWTGENTLYQVFMKGLIWLEAYEGHLRTGKSLSAYLKEM